MVMDKIVMEDLRLEYRNEETGHHHLAVQNFSLNVAENEFLCVVGASGCGKSTMLSAVAGFIRPMSGRLEMNGKPITGPGADRGVVFQEYALLPWLNVIDNVAFGLKMRGVPRAERHRTAAYFLKIANLEHAAEKFPHQLSGGMKQRVAVVRTLANEPEVILMDEPFAAVDAQTRMTLQEELVRVWEKSRITVIFVTHSVEEAVFLGDRVAVLSRGPGRVQEILPIEIPREKRTWDRMNSDPVFNARRDQILSLVRNQAA
jgi:NitT/TauT family transport system ATP-binding protein